jgi:hypothetical protein
MIDTDWVLVFDGLYAVTKNGEVKRAVDGVNTYAGKLLTPCKSANGYMIVGLHQNGKRVNQLVHRLVAEAFIGKIENGLEVNHKDGDKLNNRVENLEIVTKSENCKHAIKTGLSVPPSRRSSGNTHWTRTRPELLARGERNGAKTKPENTLRGSQCPSSKLKESQVIEIKKMYGQGFSAKEISLIFDVSSTNINYIVKGKSWKHVN